MTSKSRVVGLAVQGFFFSEFSCILFPHQAYEHSPGEIKKLLGVLYTLSAGKDTCVYMLSDDEI